MMGYGVALPRFNLAPTPKRGMRDLHATVYYPFLRIGRWPERAWAIQTELSEGVMLIAVLR